MLVTQSPQLSAQAQPLPSIVLGVSPTHKINQVNLESPNPFGRRHNF